MSNRSTIEKCPVCWRIALVTAANRLVLWHEDGAHNRCPMTGHVFPQSPWSAAA